MYAIARRTFVSRPRFSTKKCCRIIAGRRYPRSLRSFHVSAAVRQTPSNPINSTTSAWQSDGGEPVDERPTHAAEAEVLGPDGASPEPSARDKERHNNYGSAARRSSRNRKPRDIPPINIPGRFMRHNVHVREEVGQLGESLGIYTDIVSGSPKSVLNDNDGLGPGSAEKDEDGGGSTSSQSPNRYQLHQAIWKEILASIRAGLSLPDPAHANSFPAKKVHIVLQCPKDGGIYFLDSVVGKAASVIDADLVRLDGQDIAEIGGDYLGEGPEPSPHSIRSLAYDAQQTVARQDSREMEDAVEEEEDPDELEDEPSATARGPGAQYGVPMTSRFTAIPVASFTGTLDDLLKSGKALAGHPFSNGLRAIGTHAQLHQNRKPLISPGDDAKLLSMAAAILEMVQVKLASTESGLGEPVPQVKVSAVEGDAAVTPTAQAHGSQRPLIVMIRDLKEIQSTPHGVAVLMRFHSLLRNRRMAGQRVLLVGTVSSADLMPSLSRSGFRNLQAEFEDGPARTIIVTPPRTSSQESVFREDERRRMREINMRHLQDMIRQRSSDPTKTLAILSQPDLRLDSSLEYSSGLEEYVWSFDRVHRVAVTAFGLMNPKDDLTPETIAEALRLLDSSDEIKFQWALEEKEQQQEPIPISSKASSAIRFGSGSEEKMKRVRKSCNAHERKLLGGVVIPENIHTTFADVHAPSETIEGLKTLTSLSLIRPEAFSYGVLASDSIPGLLLYGPPGTGKTLLAKAVAKESRATVLEVSGSEVYDMYVGEGEKNVKAIFTLAKKLSPCVVFIDEADAIFASRGGHSSRTSHRELINQFLREWDGMNDLSAFLMVATNRPFDLDDAVLRRLPRRLLVDLPVEKDREAILRIHLKDESLEASVSLSELAAKTPFYSGSDLKNLCVAAALACVREETDEYNKHSTEKGEYKFPEKRTLAERHFEKATEEISASISEDMSSLAAIRKFDEKYGDRKGRRKKRAGWGFGSVADAQQQTETGRVRN